jgi:hypothetical protein
LLPPQRIKPTVENVDQAASSYVKDAKNKWESPGSPYGLRTSLNSIGLKKKNKTVFLHTKY